MSTDTKILVLTAQPSETRMSAASVAADTRALTPSSVACDTRSAPQSREASGEGPQGVITQQHERRELHGMRGHSVHETPSGQDGAALAARYGRVVVPLSASYARFLRSIGIDVEVPDEKNDVQLQRCDSPAVIAAGGALETRMTRHLVQSETASVPVTHAASPTKLAVASMASSAVHAPIHTPSETKVW